MKDRTKGLISALSSVVIISIASILAKSLMRSVSPVTVLFIRFLSGLLFIGGLGALGFLKIEFHNKKLHVIRGLCGAFAVTCYFLAIHYSGMAKGSVITYTYSLFTVPAAFFILREKPPLDKVVVLLFSFIGIVFLIKPDFSNINFFDLLALTGAIVAGCNTCFIRKLRRDNNAQTVVFSQVIAGSILFTVPFGFNYTFSYNNYLIPLIIVGLLAIAGRILSNHALKYLPPVEYGPISMMTVVFGITAGFLLFKETYETHHIIGTVIILSCILYLTIDPLGLIKKKSPE